MSEIEAIRKELAEDMRKELADTLRPILISQSLRVPNPDRAREALHLSQRLSTLSTDELWTEYRRVMDMPFLSPEPESVPRRPWWRFW